MTEISKAEVPEPGATNEAPRSPDGVGSQQRITAEQAHIMCTAGCGAARRRCFNGLGIPDPRRRVSIRRDGPAEGEGEG